MMETKFVVGRSSLGVGKNQAAVGLVLASGRLSSVLSRPFKSAPQDSQEGAKLQMNLSEISRRRG
jgi:hypothetical protein